MDKMQFVLSILILILMCIENDALLFKITKAHCESFNETWVTVVECRARPKSRNVTYLTVDLDVHYPANDIFLQATLKKKENGYKPFLYDITINACQFVRKPNNPVAKIVYSLFKDFSTVNHTCPYVGRNGVKDFYLRSERLNGLPVPSGDYLLLLTWYFHKKKTVVTNVYYVFEEDPFVNVRRG